MKPFEIFKAKSTAHVIVLTKMKAQRYIEIDLLRGLAIILMIIFHFGYNLNFFKLISINPFNGIWLVIARAVQFIFVLSTGLTLYISYKRRLRRGVKDAILSRLNHSAKLLFFAMLITLVTWLLYDEQAVKFGILHFYSISIPLGLLFVRFTYLAPPVAIAILLLSPWITNLATESPILFPVGITNQFFQSLDYFPLFPWFGLFLCGIYLGAILYPEGIARFSFNKALDYKIFKPLRFLGDKSLQIYLLHQPILATSVLIYVAIMK